MPRIDTSSVEEVVYQVIIGNVPQRVLRLPSTHDWREVKDELRKLGEPDPVPRCQIKNGLAWFEFKVFDEAARIFEILHLHVWERCVLDAWLFSSKDGIVRGPKDSTTGLVRLPPVPRSPAIAPMARSGHSQAMLSASPRSQRAPQAIGYSPDTSGQVTQQQFYQSLVDTQIIPAGTSRVANNSISVPSGYPSAGHIPQPHIGQSSPNARFSQGASNSSIDSSADNSFQQAPTPRSSISDSTTTRPSAAAPSPKCYRVTITNLSLQATTEVIGELIEQKTRIYVPLVHPDPIKLRKFKGQLHAYVKFSRKDDAVKAVQRIGGLKFMGRPLHAILEEVGGI